MDLQLLIFSSKEFQRIGPFVQTEWLENVLFCFVLFLFLPK